MIEREIKKNVQKKLFRNKAIVIIGARQVGKTTLLKMIAEDYKGKSLYLNCDEPDVRSILTDITSTRLKTLFGKNKLILVDEAQRVKNIGITLKIIVDELSDYQIVASGSSALELANEISEPLTGRKYEFNLFPISWNEFAKEYGALEANRIIEERMLYGMYPEIIIKHDEKEELLKSLAQSYLYKDVLSYSNIKKPELLEQLLKALALQIGNQVSYHELAKILRVDNQTISKYVDLLEKAFVIFRLPPFSRNLRTELTKMRKIYFYDTGIRNSLIRNFYNLDMRQDVGALWENFMISERMKMIKNTGLDVESYFWRTQQQQEIDYVEIARNKISAFEFTLNPKMKKKISETFINAYPKAKAIVINKDNYMGFLGL